MKHNIKLDLNIKFESKWRTGSGEGGLHADRLIRKDARNWPYIPGSTLKGVVRESCERLSRTLEFPAPVDPHDNDLNRPGAFQPLEKARSPVDRLFGNHYEGANLFFRDARLKDPPPYGYLKYQSRICSYRALGTAREKHLFSSEYAKPLEFKTTIDGCHENLAAFDEGDPPFAYCLFVAGIMNVDRLGADKSAGSGRLRITFDAIEWNGQTFSEEDIFDYLDPELYKGTRELS